MLTYLYKEPRRIRIFAFAHKSSMLFETRFVLLGNWAVFLLNPESKLCSTCKSMLCCSLMCSGVMVRSIVAIGDIVDYRVTIILAH